MFEETRKKVKDNNSTLKLLRIKNVVSWVNRMENMRQKEALL